MTEDVSSALTEVLFEKGVLVDLYIGKPTFQRKLRADDLLMEGIDQDVLYLGHKKLMPKKALEDLSTLEARSRQALAVRSIPFPISGARFVQRSVLPVLLTDLQAKKVLWENHVRALIASYPAYKEEQFKRFDEQYTALVDKELKKFENTMGYDLKKHQLNEWFFKHKSVLRELYPKDYELPGLFAFRWHMFQVSSVGIGEFDEDAQAQFQAAQAQLKADLDRWVREASFEMHRTLGAAALNAKTLLEKNGRLEVRNLRPLFAAFDTFKATEFTNASEFHKVIDQVRTQFAEMKGEQLDLELTSFNISDTTDSRSAFTSLLGSVARLAEDNVAKEAGLTSLASAGDFRRAIDL